MTDVGFTDVDARDAWNEAAKAWEVFVESGADYYRWHVHGPALLDVCGDVGGRSVLDLGCGQGYFSRELARRSARVIGIDLSDRLIQVAREHEEREPLGVHYRLLNAADLTSFLDADSFDLLTACMSVQDMADVPAVLQGALHVLRPSGRMVFSVPHPATDTRFRQWERDADGKKIALKIDGYFESGPTICHWNMPRLLYHWDTPCWRYTLSEWSAMIAGAGFVIRGLHEPKPTDEQVREFPDLEDCSRLPYFLIFDLCKASA
jgi:2-polyprenyl-3-methyl-5-hydroxy-6-metoxy-1,4-benzoquinol methylase